MWTQNDKQFMSIAHDLAIKGLGKTWPNPLVGAVVVKKNKILGKGWHRKYGGPHAEVYALQQSGVDARGATLYVNLEPCSHFGKTPPCALAVIQAGIKRVVCSMRDPHEKVAGKGFRLLRKAGVMVEVGLMKKEAVELNKVFVKCITSKSPYVISKIAMSLDGKIACENGSSQWISGIASRRYSHKIRALADAIIVGRGTATKDDPLLTIRGTKPKRSNLPLRIILEGERKISSKLKMFRDFKNQKIIIASAQSRQSIYVRKKEVPRWYLPGQDGQVDLEKLLSKLGELKMSVVMVEGGAKTHAAFLGLNKRRGKILCDELNIMIAPKILGGNTAPGPIGGVGVQTPDNAIRFSQMSISKLDDDFLVCATPRKV